MSSVRGTAAAERHVENGWDIGHRRCDGPSNVIDTRRWARDSRLVMASKSDCFLSIVSSASFPSPDTIEERTRRKSSRTATRRVSTGELVSELVRRAAEACGLAHRVQRRTSHSRLGYQTPKEFATQPGSVYTAELGQEASNARPTDLACSQRVNSSISFFRRATFFDTVR